MQYLKQPPSITLVIRKLFGARAHLVPSTCWEHILKGEGIHDQPESFVVERGLGLQEPLRENFSSSAGAFAILLYPCFQEFQSNNSCNRWMFFGFVLKIELLVSGFRELARRRRPTGECARLRSPAFRRVRFDQLRSMAWRPEPTYWL